MISRRRVLRVAGPSALFQLCAPGWALAADGQAFSRELFSLGRSKNKNIVRYGVRTTQGGELDRDRPIDAYWLMFAENGRREELSWAERQLAYGFSVSAVQAQACRLQLTACADRELRVRRTQGRYVAELSIAGQVASLQHIFVTMEDQALLPSVRYVEISGVNGAGQRVVERLLPRRVSRFR